MNDKKIRIRFSFGPLSAIVSVWKPAKPRPFGQPSHSFCVFPIAHSQVAIRMTKMIKGDCRVIPAVLESGRLPPEVAGLLYADFKTSFPNGVKGILTALSYEASRVERNERFWVRAEHLIERVFGGRGSVSLQGEYQSRNYEIIQLDVPNYEDDYTSVVYEVVS